MSFFRNQNTSPKFPWIYWGAVLLVYALLVFLLPEKSHSDMWYWSGWMEYCAKEELGTIYQYQLMGTVPTNYHPFFLHCLNIFQGCFDTFAEAKENLHFVKAIPLFFDFLGACSIFLLIKNDWRKGHRTFFLPFLLIFNIGYLYNSFFWGQVDSIFTTWALLAIIFAIRQQPGWSLVFYLLAINTKLQAIIFLPLLLLLLLPSLFSKWKSTLLGLLVAGLIQTLLLWPFIKAGQLSVMIDALVSGSVDFYPRTSLSAYNLWYAFFGGNSVMVSDTELYRGITYKTWGLLLFCLSSTIALLPVLLRTLRLWWEQKVPDDRSKELFFLSATLVSLAFFFFNTQMHERYSHPAMIMAFFYGFYRKNYLIYVVVSTAYFLNLEKVLKIFDLHYHTLIFDPLFTALLYAIAISLAIGAILKRHSFLPDLQFMYFSIRKKWA